ncbi:MAG: hypothetical protein IPH60_10715 [Flavobacteriales bacterium]|nr:hypothetical protein [Flavobacteriales bacterium]
MVRSIGLTLLFAFALGASAQWRFEGNTTPTWEQTMERFQAFAATRSGVQLLEIGTDDDGSPIHLIVLSDGSGFTPDSIRAAGKNILWITNAIHAGEPDGVDASLLLTQALLDSDQYMGLLAHTVVCIVPMYNVSGARQRSSTSLANQNGPAEYGFRANARNLDLNRDFIKADASNTRALVSALTAWDPDVYLETHVTNGADHQYVMELLTTHPDKVDPAMSAYMRNVLSPRLHRWMDDRGMLMGPYFETVKHSPEEGLTGFMDGPRYSTGYNALRGRVALISEAHMLKPYADRVNATFQLMLGTLAAMNEYPVELRDAIRKARANAATEERYATNWTLDTAHSEPVEWLGYEARYTKSTVTGLDRLYYDQGRPTKVDVPWFDHGISTLEIVKPKAYLIPQAWHEVIDRLALDNVPMERLDAERSYQGEVHRIMDFETTSGPYEGHYLHHGIPPTTEREEVTGRPGDVLVPMGHPTDQLVMEILEPRCADSYFAWGFFDTMLQQKEWFSDYVFEDIAADLLVKDAALKAAFEAKRNADPAFAKDDWAQLYFVYQRSPYFEPNYRRYPVVRITK